MARLDPLRGFRYLVEIEGIAAGGFSKVKGLVREVKFESYREGGVNDYEHKLVTQTTHPILVLERGLALPHLWKWALDASRGEVVRRKITVLLQDETAAARWVWHADHALPVKWSCSDLDAAASPVVIESLELAHHGLRTGP